MRAKVVGTIPAAPPKQSLLAMTEEYSALERALIESGGEFDETVVRRLAELGELMPDKIDGYDIVIRRFVAFGQMCRQEARWNETQARAADTAIANLKKRLAFIMEQRETTVLQGRLRNAYLEANGGQPSVNVLVQPETLPVRLQRWSCEANKTAIREAMVDGALWLDAEGNPSSDTIGAIKAAELVTPGTHVIFR